MNRPSRDDFQEVGSGNGPTSAYSQESHLRLRVSGVVQGVGFRPFIYNLARRHGLAGTVLNNSRGVEIHIQGRRNIIEAFVHAIRDEAPTASRIDAMHEEELPPEVFADFRILASETTTEAFTHVSPDLAICADCRRELADSGDRRYGYPFINCTNCGPRFTIIQALPYDRPQTTMSEFRLCTDCRRDYEDPADRRFHAQPVACEICGPKLCLMTSDGDSWTETSEEPILRAAKLLRNREILMIQGIGGFHLAVDACDETAVRELRVRKKRDEKPFAVMFPDEDSLRKSCIVSDLELRYLSSPRAPILLLKRTPESPLCEAIAPGNPYVGAMLPYSPLHVLLLQAFGGPLVMTSANLSDEPISYRNDDALKRMAGIADGALIHERAIHVFADDSVVKVIGGVARVWRRSRGYVPESVHVPQSFRKQTLAFGPQMKNTFCLGKREFALLSQHMGDLDSEHAITAQQQALHHFLRLFDAKIERAACDLHPDYTTTRFAEAWARERGIPLIRVQHHHAHLASCLAENGRSERVIGVILDGTGYGTDGSIWGGEVLIGNFESFRRAAHLQETFMPGGETAAKQPWRMALAWLYEAYGDPCNWPQSQLYSMIRNEIGESGLNDLCSPALRLKVFPRTTSLGRLFDAVSALTFFGTKRQHEGQAAMLLEGMISTASQDPYPFELRFVPDELIISPLPMIRALVEDSVKGIPAPVIARRFHEGLTNALVKAAESVRERSGISVVAFSGGCFQNAFLHTTLEERLLNRGFSVLTHRQVPPNDGGVSLGQAVIANAQED